MYNPFSIENKTILVVGASSGIGRATAITCAKMGAIVIAVGRDQSRLQETLNTMDHPDAHYCFVLDLADENTWNNMLSAMPVVDGIACCAGVADMNPFTFISREEIDMVFNTNCFGPILLLQRLIKTKNRKKLLREMESS